MKHSAGWQMPPTSPDVGAYLSRAEHLHEQVKYGHRFRSCVQAGGHIGITPMYLSEYFKHVYTFELDFDNFQCLVANCTRRNIYAMRGVLGREHGGVAMRANKYSSGHSVGHAGKIPTWQIDDLNLPDCDALFLDVEGSEMAALEGAKFTIDRCRPLIVAEDNKKRTWFGRKEGDMTTYLATFGYAAAATLGEDIIYTPTQKEPT
jgi:FkbM family methyltransferase